MKSTSIFLLLALFAIADSANALSTKPITTQSGKPVPAERIYQPELTQPSPANTARVMFLRDSGMLGAGCIHQILVDGKAVFGIRAGEFQALYLAPGEHLFSLEIEAGFCPPYSVRRAIALSDGMETSFRILIPSTFGTPQLVNIDELREFTVSSPDEPPFKWDYHFSTPGTSFTMKEKSRIATARGTEVAYEFSAMGFSANAPATLWKKHLNSYLSFDATIEANGAVKIRSTQGFVISQYVPGEAVDFALVSGDDRAHVKTFPFPIVAQESGYLALVELMSDTGLHFEITFGGFQPGEKVEIKIQHNDEKPVNSTSEASATGEVVIPAQFDRSDRGTATAAATGSNGTVSIQYKVGKKALVWQ